MKIQFECDYEEGAHPRIMQKLVETNLVQTCGYGEDEYCKRAQERIREVFACQDADVHFLVGGTQANLTVISSILRPHQGVVCADSRHINVHETGAVEATGHKVLAIPGKDGKISAKAVKSLLDAHWNDTTHEHMVQPGMVYISFPTENGTLYSKEELKELHEVCREWNLPLFLDGARLGYGLASKVNDVEKEDLAKLCDVFYIGGTKVGALMGEAVVIVNDKYKQDFRYMMKQKGGMLAKGRLLGIQFETLFEDGLYFRISEHADHLAMKLKQGLLEKGYPLLFDSHTNQQFPIIPDEKLKELEESFTYSYWERIDMAHSAVRLCTSWATKEEAVDDLLSRL